MRIWKRTKKIWIAAAATLLLLVCLSAFWGIRADALAKAKESASPYLSGSTEFLSGYFTANRCVLRYFDTVNQERIEIEVSTSSRKVIKMQVQKAGYQPKGGSPLDDTALRTIFEGSVAGKPAKDIRLSRSSDLAYAEITYSSADSRGSYILDSVNGTLISYTIKYGSPVVIPYSSTGSRFRILLFSELKRIAAIQVPGAVFQDLDIVYSNEIFLAEIDLYSAGRKHVLVLDAGSGRMLSHKSYKDSWQAYGSWEPVELVSPLISIANLDASLTLPGSGSSFSSSPNNSATSVSSGSGESTSGSAGSSASTSIDPGSLTSTSSYSSASSDSAASQIPDATPTPEPAITAVPTGPATISISRVKDIVLSRLPGAQFVGVISLDTDDERLLYEGKAISGATQVSFEIDAYTGIIAKWELDAVDDD